MENTARILYTWVKRSPSNGRRVQLALMSLDDDKSGTVYILYTAAKIAVPTDAVEVTINLVHDDKPELLG